jgi:type I restriction enzyme S subunit
LGIPDLAEQKEIAGRLDREMSDLDRLVDKTKRFIALTKERRSALITATVTGQIDVREMAGG